MPVGPTNLIEIKEKMPRQRFNERPAEFIRRMGWNVEDIIIGGKEYDSGPITLQITAIGTESVIARKLLPGGGYDRECLWTFGLRDWTH